MKPENVLITPDHQVKVMDLGVARLAEEALRLSQTGAFVGSIQYAAPEQFRGGGDTDARSDLYALGLLLYELAVGVNPFAGGSVPEMLRRVLHDEPRRAGEANPQLSAFYEDVVHQLLAKKPDERIQTAVELAEILEQGEQSAWWQKRAREIQADTSRPLRRPRIARDTVLCGRDAEVAALRSCFERAKGGEGQVVLVSGEAGIGKTRLVDELVGRLHAGGEDFDFLFGSYPPGGASSTGGAFSTAYREQFGEDGSARRLADLPLLVPAFDALLRGEPPPPGAVRLDLGSIETCFAHATRSLAAERPQIVLIDDLNYASEEGRTLYASLARSIASERVLLIGTLREGTTCEAMSGVGALPHATQLELSRLGAKDLAQLLVAVFRSERLADELGFRIAQKSDGNPFFLFEILRGLRESGLISERDDGSWTRTGEIRDIEIPSSVMDLIEARIHGLDEEDQEVLDVAACCGYRFDPLLVAATLGLSRIPLLRQLGRLERTRRLVRSAGMSWTFDHHQVQQALYDGISELLRREYHGALGDTLERLRGAADADPETLDGELVLELCEHFLRSGDADRTRRYVFGAVTHLERSYLNESAVDLCQRALDAPGLLEPEQRCRILNRQAATLSTMGRREAERIAVDACVRLADEIADVVLRIGARERRTWYLLAVVRLAEAERVAAGSIAIGRADGTPAQLRIALHAQTVCLYAMGRYAEGLAVQDDIVRSAAEDGNASALRSLGHRGLFLSRLGHHSEAIECLETSVRDARERKDLPSLGIGLVNLGPIWSSLGEHAKAREILTESRRTLRQVGHRRPESYALHRLGNALVRAGDPAAARRRYAAALEIRTEIGYRGGKAESLIRLAALDVDEGRTDEARAALEEAAEIARDADMPGARLLAAVHLARLPGYDAKDALQIVTGLGDRVEHDILMESRYRLWTLTGDGSHLAEAHRLLEVARDHAPPEFRDSMVANVPIQRAIAADFAAAGR